MGWRGLKNKKCLQLRRHQNFASEPRPPSTEFKCNIQLHPRLFRVLGPHFRSHQEPPSRTPAPGASPRPECQVQAPSRPRRSPGTGRRVGDARASAAARTPANRAPLPGSRLALPPARRAATTQARLGPPRAGGCGVSGGEGGCPASPSLPPSSPPSAAALSAFPAISLTGLPLSSPPAFRPPCSQSRRRPTGAAAAASGWLLRFLPGSSGFLSGSSGFPSGSSGFPSPPRVARRKPARRLASSPTSPLRPMGPSRWEAAPAPWRWRTERAPGRREERAWERRRGSGAPPPRPQGRRRLDLPRGSRRAGGRRGAAPPDRANVTRPLSPP